MIDNRDRVRMMYDQTIAGVGNLRTIYNIHGTFEDEADGNGNYPQMDSLQGQVNEYDRILIVESIDNGKTWEYNPDSFINSKGR
jgi:hypothetical protein